MWYQVFPDFVSHQRSAVGCDANVSFGRGLFLSLSFLSVSSPPLFVPFQSWPDNISGITHFIPSGNSNSHLIFEHLSMLIVDAQQEFVRWMSEKKFSVFFFLFKTLDRRGDSNTFRLPCFWFNPWNPCPPKLGCLRKSCYSAFAPRSGRRDC